jgi:hypothetical protein
MPFGAKYGGRVKGTPNRRSLPAIKAAIAQKHPDLDSLSLARFAAATVVGEMNKLTAAGRYDPDVLVDWAVKLARVVESYISFEYARISPIERDDRHDNSVQVQADLSRLNTEQLITLKQLALIASAGSTVTTNRSTESPNPTGKRPTGVK